MLVHFAPARQAHYALSIHTKLANIAP